MPLFVKKMEEINDSRFELIHSKLRTNNFLKIIAIFIEQWIIFKQIPKDSSVWFYNLNSINALLFILLKIFKSSVKTNIIVLDFTPIKKGFGLNSIYLKLINKADGRICLANSSIFKTNNSVILPGVVPNRMTENPEIKKINNQFLLSGVLNENISQISLILKVFSKLPNCVLHITGKSNNEIIEKYTSKYNNIIYHKQLPYNEYIILLHSITYQLSTRNPNCLENQCNFPSKIIEALLHNRIIISTIHYEQLKDFKYIEISSDETKMTKDIINLISLEENKILDFANQSSLVKKLFSTKEWEIKMNYIESSNK